MTNSVPVHTARAPYPDEDWSAVADAVNARMIHKRIGQKALSDASGVSVATLRRVQHGAHGRRVQNQTLTAIARALDWPDDYLIRLLRVDAAPTGLGQITEENILAGLHRIEQHLDDVAQCLVRIEEVLTVHLVHR
jgi:DNA-binding Xre family transcriptional regulator